MTESRKEDWYRAGVTNDGYENNENDEDGNHKKCSPFPILHIPCDENDPRQDNVRNSNLSMRRENRLNMTHYSRPTILDRKISPVKLKRNRLRRFWKLKFVRENSDTHKRFTIIILLLLALLLFITVLGIVLYLTVGGGLEEDSTNGVKPQKLQNRPTEILASRVVLGMFKLKHLRFDEALRNRASTKFVLLSKDVKSAMDRLFKSSVLSMDYNGTDIISFRNGSIVVDCRIYLRRPFIKVAAKVGMAFINGLINSRGQMLLDSRFDVDVQSIMFTATHAPRPKILSNLPEPGWSQWSAWSSCNNILDFNTHPKCDENVKQNRIRVCRENGGHGALMRDDEICEEQGGYPMEERLCNCDIPTHRNQSTDSNRRKCIDCYQNEICLSLENEIMATCRKPVDFNDPTGCGGLCFGPNKLCRSLGRGAYQCIRDSVCKEDEWKCHDGACIKKSAVCDGHFNCFDNSDESNCSCPKDHFQCVNTSICIRKSKRCDGAPDCYNGSDEENCPKRFLCDFGHFACQSGMCIPDKNFCDHYPDCDDGSDEPEGCNIECSSIGYKISCRNGRCIGTELLCNGEDNCGDGSDEEHCSTTELPSTQEFPKERTKIDDDSEKFTATQR